jgi:two-component system LytT family response regulator
MKTMNVNYSFNNDEARPSIIVLPTCKGIMVIPVQQIIRIQSISNYSKLFFKDACPATSRSKTLVVAKVLHWFEELPQLSSFVRIHRTHLVNINYINVYTGTRSGELLLDNGEIFSVAKRRKAGLAGRLNNLNHSFVPSSSYTSPFNIKNTLAV